MKLMHLPRALRIALVYGIVGAAWVVVSDFVGAHLEISGYTDMLLNLGKGLGFIAVTTVVMYLQLREGETRYERIFRHSPAINLLIDPGTGAIVDANPAACAFYGYDYAALTRMNITAINVLPPEQIAAEMMLAKRDGRDYFSFPHRLASGEIRQVEARSGSIAIGRRKLLYSIIQDVTDRHRLETALRESEAYYFALFEGAGDAIFVHDLNGRFLDVNRVACERLGYSREELLGMSPANIDTPEFAALLPGRIKEITSDRPVFFETVHLRRDGSEIPIELSCRLIEYEGRQAVLSIARDITERKQAEESLRASETRFRTLVDSMEDVVFTIDPDGRITGIYGRGAAQYSIPKETTLGRTFLETNLADKEIHQAAAVSALSGRHIVYNWSVLIEGKRWHLHNSLSPLRNSRGKVMGVVGIAHDVTESVEAEAAIHQSESRLRRVLENMPVMLNAFNSDGSIAVWNQECERVLGYSAEETVGLPQLAVAEMVYPDSAYRERMLAEWAARGSNFRDWEWEATGKDGSRKTVAWSSISDQFPVIGWSSWGIGIDVTARKWAEQELRASHTLLQKVLGSLNETVIIGDPYTRVIQDCNLMTSAMTGYTREELIGKSTRILYVNEEEFQQVGQEIRRAFAEDRNFMAEHHYKCKNGNILDTELYVTPLYDDQGRIIAALYVTRDVTEQKRAKEEIEKRVQQLAALNVIASAVSSSLEDLPQVLETLSNVLGVQMASPGGTIFTYHETEEQLRLEVTWGLPPNVMTELQSFPAALFHSQQVIWEQQIILKSDFRQIASFVALGLSETRPDWQSYLCVPLLAKGKVQGILELFSRAPDIFTEDQLPFFSALGRQIGIAIYNAHLFDQLREGQERLRLLSHRLVEVQEAERRHVARELHDEIGQVLTGLKFVLERNIQQDCNENTQHQLGEARTLVNMLMAQVRELSLDLRPTMLDDLGLLPALLWHIERYTNQTGVRVILRHAGLDERFPSEIETAAYRIAQEGLTNVARHARVGEVILRLWVDENRLIVQIEDQGLGFDPQSALTSAKSSGLAGMVERAHLLGGRLTMDSKPGTGTVITAELPLHGENPSSGAPPEFTPPQLPGQTAPKDVIND